MVAETDAGRRVGAVAPSRDARSQYASWQRRETPAVEEVRDGVWSVPTPIPQNPLGYTLSYALETTDGLVLIDNGWRGDDAWKALCSGIRDMGHRVQDISDVLLTHTHIDHHGLTGRIVEAAGARVHMHRLESRTLSRDIARQPQTDFVQWLDDRGAPHDEAAVLTHELDSMTMSKDFSTMALADHELEDAARPVAALPALRVVFTPGHTSGHTCFLLESEGLLFSGDHLLPRITPHITRAPGDEGDPLGEYLDSLRVISDLDVNEVLPAHEYRFVDLASRVDMMLAHHRERLDEIEAAAPGSTWEIAASISWARGWQATAGITRQLALSETLTHLIYLAGLRRLRRSDRLPDVWEISH